MFLDGSILRGCCYFKFAITRAEPSKVVSVKDKMGPHLGPYDPATKSVVAASSSDVVSPSTPTDKDSKAASAADRVDSGAREKTSTVMVDGVAIKINKSKAADAADFTRTRCDDCGTGRKCPKCGHKLSPDDRFCPKCCFFLHHRTPSYSFYP